MARIKGLLMMGNILTGTDGDDDITGGYLPDLLRGANGDDTIHGLGGRDTIYGGSGDDTLYGDDGEDTIYGGADNDHIEGGANDDTLYGDGGNDTFVDFKGNNTIDGGTGRDTVDYSEFFGGHVRVDLMTGEGIRYSQIAVAGPDGTRSDVYFEVDGIDQLTSIENVTGGAGIDYLLGNNSSNFLNGGAGQDSLTGRGGADYFIFSSVADTRGDMITDFDLMDQIVLSQIDARTDVAGDQAFGFVDRFTGHSGELVLSKFPLSAFLQGDVDGDGAADFAINITGDMAHLTASSFIL